MVLSSPATAHAPRVAWPATVSPAGRALLERHARSFRVDVCLFRQEGDPCSAVTILAAGMLRVVKRRPSGREITIYTVGPGELCALEVLAVLAGTPYRAEAIVEEPTTGFAVPADIFRRLVDTEPGLRAELYRTFEARLALALELVGDIALGTLEARLAGALVRRAGGSADVEVTHDRLAQELACTREVVSRILGAWERAGIVRLGRGHVEVLDPARLGSLAAGLAGAPPDHV